MMQHFLKKNTNSTSSSADPSSGGKKNNAEDAANSLSNFSKKYTDGVWLKYKEGFINAVRYNIKINQLL